MDETDRVIEAWTNHGPVPWYHRQYVWWLRRRWPALASALDELATVRGKKVP